MISIRINNLAFCHPSKPIFSRASCELQDGLVYGVIGANGSGKTTLLKLILGQLIPDQGHVQIDKSVVVEYMPQEVELNPALSAFESIRSGAVKILNLEKRLIEIENRFENPEITSNAKKLSRLIEEQHDISEEYIQAGGPGLEGKIITLLKDLGFSEREFHLPVASLSGGQKKLLSLARIMVGKPGILLLDEPDNHLDLNGKQRLEKLIQNFNGTVLLVSHDRYFLDMVVDGILEIENQNITSFSGTYSEFIFEKQCRQKRQNQLFQAQQHEVTRLEMAAKRLLNWGKVYDNPKFSKRGMAILKRLEKVERVEESRAESRPMELSLDGWSGSRRVLEVTNVSKSFMPAGAGHQQDLILKKIDLKVGFGERIGLIGTNGAGKSLLVKLIMGEFFPDTGSIEMGPSARIGYYSQEFDTLDRKQELLELICKTGNFNETRGVAFLQKFGFDYQMRNIRIGNLSGGERARLQIALITLSGANFLILDEPTNYLDIPSSEVLEEALLDFNGSILTISHDRYFLDRVATRIISLSEGVLKSYPGNYSWYENFRHNRTKGFQKIE